METMHKEMFNNGTHININQNRTKAAPQGRPVKVERIFLSQKEKNKEISVEE